MLQALSRRHGRMVGSIAVRRSFRFGCAAAAHRGNGRSVDRRELGPRGKLGSRRRLLAQAPSERLRRSCWLNRVGADGAAAGGGAVAQEILEPAVRIQRVQAPSGCERTSTVPRLRRASLCKNNSIFSPRESRSATTHECAHGRTGLDTCGTTVRSLRIADSAFVAHRIIRAAQSFAVEPAAAG